MSAGLRHRLLTPSGGSCHRGGGSPEKAGGSGGRHFRTAPATPPGALDAAAELCGSEKISGRMGLYLHHPNSHFLSFAVLLFTRIIGTHVWATTTF